jgi:hypothetical protein
MLRPLANYGKQVELLEPEEWLWRIAEHESMDAVVFWGVCTRTSECHLN